MYLVVLVEEPSMKIVLEDLLPRVLPDDVGSFIVSFQGKGDLMNNIELKLKAWGDPEARFVIVRDQDRNDCHDIKAEIVAEVKKTDRLALVRIVCHELESWYFGDLDAVSKAYGKDYTSYENKRGYRDPDAIQDVKKKFVRMIPRHQQIAGAKLIAPYMSIDRNRSRSFNAFVTGVRDLVARG